MGIVTSVSARKGHRLSKDPQLSIRLIAGQGVEGDAHCGEKVKHRSRVRANPDQPNLRQVHLIHSELLDKLATKGFALAGGELGENILTTGIDLLGLATGAVLAIGDEARIEITGLRNPCIQLNQHKPSLMEAVLDRAADGTLIRECGIMGIVLTGGEVMPGNRIIVADRGDPSRPLQPV